jgi:hypothetical protein
VKHCEMIVNDTTWGVPEEVVMAWYSCKGTEENRERCSEDVSDDDYYLNTLSCMELYYFYHCQQTGTYPPDV